MRVDVERQEVPDSVPVLGAIEAAQGFRAPGIRLRNGRRIKRRLEPGQQGTAILLRRLGHVWRRHGADVHLAHHLFPDFYVPTRVGEVGPVQHEVGSLDAFVVARDAVLIEQGAACASLDVL
jgi:hypothetical protein